MLRYLTGSRERTLRRFQLTQYRCEACLLPDTRTLQLDHVYGWRFDPDSVQVLCANCHSIKSREVDFTGNPAPLPPGTAPASRPTKRPRR